MSTSYRLIIKVYRHDNKEQYDFGYMPTNEPRMNMLQFAQWLREKAYRIDPGNHESAFLAIAQVRDAKTGKLLDGASLRCS